MKVFYYLVFVLILIIGACSVETEETSTTSDYGTSDGSASSPVELTVGTAKEGSFAKYGNSYYKFTPSSTGAGSYKLAIGSLSVSDSWSSSSSVTTYLYSDSGYSTSTQLDSESCLASCTLNFDYAGLDNGSTYYLKIYGWGKGTFSLTVSQGGSEGSVNNPVALTLATAHTGKVEGTSSYGKSYYKFTTSSHSDPADYTLTMTNTDSMDCDLYSDSGFTTLVSSSRNGCTAGANLSATFTGSGGSGLTQNTTYYLRIEGQSSTAKASTYNITVEKD
jgi:hypothetical protein